MAENNNVLKLYKGEAHKIRVEEAKEFKDSYFLDAYRQALRCFHDIHVDNEKNRESGREFNNVIAFCGERGSGKTSAMMSFRDMLSDWKKQHEHLPHWANDETVKKLSKNLRFVCLDAVDPSRFEPNDRLSGTVLSELYRRYAEKEKKEKHAHVDIQRKLEKSFSSLLNGIQLLSAYKQSPFGDPRSPESEFEVLNGIAGAAGLRMTFHGLVENYLRYELNQGTSGDLEDTYLVIPVDDLDLSVEHAFNLAEDIRKYLHVPNVIILIAMKLDQLRIAVEQANYTRFSDIRKAVKRPSPKYIEEMSNMYLEKLIPVHRRIVLPIFGNFENANSQRIYYGERQNEKSKEDSKLTGEDWVLRLIREKTLLDFRKYDNAIHPLVPRTLRELQNLLEFLDDLEAPIENPNSTKVTNPGLEKFTDYFFEFWVPNALNRDEEEAIYDIKKSDYASRNAVAAMYLGKFIGKFRGEYSEISTSINIGDPNTKGDIDNGVNYQPDIHRIMSAENYRYNISLGDVLLLLKEIDRLDVFLHARKFSFAIKAMYSIDIVKLLVFRSFSAIDAEGRSNLGDLIGGTFFHPKFIDLLPEPSNNSNYYSYIPKAVPAIEVEAYYKNKRELYGYNDRIIVDKPLDTPMESGEKNLTQYILSKWNNSPSGTSKTTLEDTEKIPSFLGFSSIIYLGELSYKPTYRTLPHRWYLQTPNLLGVGRTPSHLSLDFKGVFFWNLVPELNVYRIYGSSRDKYLEKYDLNSNAGQTDNDEDTAPILRNKIIKAYFEDYHWIHLIKIFQIDVLTEILNKIQIAIDRSLKSRKSERSFGNDLEKFLKSLKQSIEEELLKSISEEKKKSNPEIGVQLASETFPWLFDELEKIITVAKEIDKSYFHLKKPDVTRRDLEGLQKIVDKILRDGNIEKDSLVRSKLDRALDDLLQDKFAIVWKSGFESYQGKISEVRLNRSVLPPSEVENFRTLWDELIDILSGLQIDLKDKIS